MSTPSSSSSPPRPLPGSPTGVKVVIVGAGIGGLACAIESRLQGHEVVVLEAVKQFRRLGDSIGCFPNSGKLIKRWGIHEELMPHCGTAMGYVIKKWSGEQLVNENRKDGMEYFRDAPLYDTHRAELHNIMCSRAIELGAVVKQGVRVLEYSEDESGASVTVDGETFRGDVVIGADGVKSKARELVLGFADAPKPSGYAIFRAFFDADLLRSDPACAHLAPIDSDARTVWLAPDIHFIVSTLKKGEEVNYVFTHKDTADVAEGWVESASISDVLALLDDTWDPSVRALVEKTPAGALLDWKLVYRDPLPRWVSERGHIACMGDAAHPFLPTSQQGASQAIEDGVTIAHVLKLAKEKGQPLALALKVYERLRMERVAKAQALGVSTRKMWHEIDWSKTIEGDKIKLPAPFWLWDHDATAFTLANYDQTVAELTSSSTATEQPLLSASPIEPVAPAAAGVAVHA